MDVSLPHCGRTKKSGEHVQDRDSSSTHSTGQSHSETASLKESVPCGLPVVSGYNDTQGRLVGGHKRPPSSITSPESVFPSQIDFSHSMAHAPFHCAETYFGGFISAYGPQAMFHHPQMMGMSPGRVPLPLGVTEDEPIYVNAKQYHAILRRRQFRAKLEAQNKLVKVRKPYLHESRHVHALKRARGSGGRFLNMKKLENSKPNSASHKSEVSGSAQLNLTGNISESNVQKANNYQDGASTTSCSELTGTSNSDDMFPRLDLRFSGYLSHMGGTMQVPLVAFHGGGGNQQHVSIFR